LIFAALSLAMSYEPQTSPGGEYVAPPAAMSPINTFRRDLFRATPRVFVTHIIIAINVAIFLLMALSSHAFFGFNGQTMYRWGAGFGPATTHGQAWRLFTEMFLHFGIIHVGMNMIVLWQAGPLVERLFGNFAYAVIYIFSGLTGSFLSLQAHPLSLAAGASGAVFGVYGALLGFLAVQRGTIPPPLLKSLFNSAGVFVIYNIAFGSAVRGIDMYAHGGGLVGGVVLGAILSRKLERGANLGRTVVVAVLGVVIAGYLAGHLRPISPPESDDQGKIAGVGRFL
jgi:rhomboid protease GluP